MSRYLALGVVLALVMSHAFAEWTVLKNSAGHVVEVVTDFTIKNLIIQMDGSVSFKASALIDGEELGFSVLMSKPRESDIAILFQERRVPIMRIDLDITSSGAATKNLEHRLSRDLGVSAGGMDALRVIGPRSGTCPFGAASIAAIALIHAGSVGYTYDERGKQSSGECFGLDLVIDAPANRLIAHFYEASGYGGTATKDRARNDWIMLHQKIPANQQPEPTR